MTQKGKINLVVIVALVAVNITGWAMGGHPVIGICLVGATLISSIGWAMWQERADIKEIYRAYRRRGMES